MNERERIARFLNLEGNHPLLHARIRGLRSVELARRFVDLEARHKARQPVIAAINQRIAELQAREDGPTPAEPASDGDGESSVVATDGGDEAPLSAGEDCPECGDAELREVTVRERVGLWCPECADFRGEA